MTYRIEKDAVTSGEASVFTDCRLWKMLRALRGARRAPPRHLRRRLTFRDQGADLTSSVAGPYATMLLSDFWCRDR